MALTTGAASARESPRGLSADEHAATRVGIRLALEESGFVVCAEAATGPTAVAAALREEPDVCLLEVRVPGGGIEAAASIRTNLSKTHVVMLSMSEDDRDVFDALRAGASGYPLKGVVSGRLGPTVLGVLDGQAELRYAL